MTSDLLNLAVNARLPIIAAHTRDCINLMEVLEEVTGKKPVRYNPSSPAEKNKFYVFIHTPKIALPLIEIYNAMVSLESSLLIVNAPKIEDIMFDAGEVPVPRTMMYEFMNAVVEDDQIASELLRGLGGCTLKEVAEFARLTTARDTSLTLPGIMATRKSSFQGQNGLTPVDTAQGFYEPPEALEEWVAQERPFFLHGTDPRLIPRGLLFDGPPGTGKTAGAKWIADKIGVPLYRVDVGGTKGKYVGQSENQMLQNLSRIDHEEPCVALIDEVEKVFSSSTNDTSGTTSTMLSQLLWWLAERRSRVLVVMTTNNSKTLPRELYREGRVDRVMWFGGLDASSPAENFVRSVLGTFKLTENPTAEVVKKIVKDTVITSKIPMTDPPYVSQAALTTAAYAYVKAVLLNTLPID